MEPDILTIKEASEYLGVSEISIRRWTNCNKLKHYRLNGHRRFFKKDLEKFKSEVLPNFMNDELLSIEDTAKCLRVSVSTIRRWNGKKLQPVNTGYRRKIFFKKDEVMSLLKAAPNTTIGG